MRLNWALLWQYLVEFLECPLLARFTRSVSEAARPQLLRKAAGKTAALLECPLSLSSSWRGEKPAFCEILTRCEP